MDVLNKIESTIVHYFLHHFYLCLSMFLHILSSPYDFREDQVRNLKSPVLL